MVKNESVYCQVWHKNGWVFYYGLLDRVTPCTPYVSGVCGMLLAGNLRYDFLTQETLWPVCETSIAPSGLEVWELRNKLENMDVEHISADHHMHINYHEIGACAKDILTKVGAIADKSLELFTRRVTAITVIMYAAVTTQLGRDTLVRAFLEAGGSENEFFKYLKRESMAAKQMQHIHSEDLSSIFEIHVIQNRIAEEVDWAEERSKRTQPCTVRITSAQVYQRALHYFKIGAQQGYRPRKRSWKQYWTLRHGLIPGGSITSQYDADKLIKQKLPYRLRNKAAFVDEMGEVDFSHFCSRKPSIYATTSTKYEWGKVRALYGCDITSFLMADFSMPLCEESLPGEFMIGSAANESRVKKTVGRMLHGIPFCFDYDDFNSQHSTSAMVAVLKAWGDVHCQYMSNEQRIAYLWTVKSLQQVEIKDPDGVYKAHGTLMLGWRLTTFMNTVLNKVYLDYSGLDAFTSIAIHSGDDMFASVPTVGHALKLLRAAVGNGVRAQPSKMNIGSIAEFLRIDGRATNSCGAQYLARAVATWCHGRTESASPRDLRDVIQANTTRSQEVVQRGGDARLVHEMTEAQSKGFEKIFKVEADIIEQLSTSHPMQGGIDDKAGIKRTALDRTHDDTDIQELDEKLCRNGILTYYRAIMDQLQIDPKYQEPENYYRRVVKEMVKTKVGYRIVTDNLAHKKRLWYSLYQTHKTSRFVLAIVRTRCAGLPAALALPGITNGLATIIREAREPIAFMQAIM